MGNRVRNRILMARRGRKSSIRMIVSILVGAVVLVCVMDSLRVKHGVDIGLGSLDSLNIPFVQELETWLDSYTQDSVAVTTVAVEGEVRVSFLDVGQAKSILIAGPEACVLIDGGEHVSADYVTRRVREAGITRIDTVIATHPHSDHIGGLSGILRAFEIGELIMPEIPDALVPTTATFGDLLDAIEDENIPLVTASTGLSRALGGGAMLTVISTAEGNFDNLNDISVVSRLDLGDVSFLFTGDIEKAAERSLMERYAPLSATVLDVAHHGSNTSSTAPFLDRVRPQFAIISCGADNGYGHPHRDCVQRLRENGATLLRTDLRGDIVMTVSEGEIHYETQR